MKIGIHAYDDNGPTAQGVDRARAVGAEGICLGITYCPGGALAGDDMNAVRERFHDRIHFAHLRDQIGLWDDFQEVFPGTGEVGVAELVRGLCDSGYDGLICPEHLGPEQGGRDLEAEALQYLRDVRGK